MDSGLAMHAEEGSLDTQNPGKRPPVTPASGVETGHVASWLARLAEEASSKFTKETNTQCQPLPTPTHTHHKHIQIKLYKRKKYSLLTDFNGVLIASAVNLFISVMSTSVCDKQPETINKKNQAQTNYKPTTQDLAKNLLLAMCSFLVLFSCLS